MRFLDCWVQKNKQGMLFAVVASMHEMQIRKMPRRVGTGCFKTAENGELDLNLRGILFQELILASIPNEMRY